MDGRVLDRFFFARGGIRFYVFFNFALLSFGFVVELYLAVVL